MMGYLPYQLVIAGFLPSTALTCTLTFILTFILIFISFLISFSFLLLLLLVAVVFIFSYSFSQPPTRFKPSDGCCLLLFAIAWWFCCFFLLDPDMRMVAVCSLCLFYLVQPCDPILTVQLPRHLGCYLNLLVACGYPHPWTTDGPIWAGTKADLSEMNQEKNNHRRQTEIFCNFTNTSDLMLISILNHELFHDFRHEIIAVFIRICAFSRRSRFSLRSRRSCEDTPAFQRGS